MSGIISGARGDLMLRGYNSAALRRQQKPPPSSGALRKSGSFGNLAKPAARCRCQREDQQFAQLENQYMRNLQQQLYFLELENTYLKTERKKDTAVRPKLIGEADSLLEKLRKTRHEQQMTESELRQRDLEVDQVVKDRDLIADRIKNIEEGHIRDKKALSEELVELRKQLDDCRPELAKKEAHLTRAETELQDALAELRTVKGLCDSFRTQLDHKGREENAMANLESERRAEIEQLLANIKSVESDLSEYRSRETLLRDELNELKRTLREAELQARKEKALGEKILEDNDQLIKENSVLTAQVSQATNYNTDNSGPLLRAEYALSELAETRESEKNARVELLKLRESLKAEQAQVRLLSNQLNEQENVYGRMTDGRNRLQKELDALELSARQLGAENQQLRRDKLSLGSKVDELSKMVSNKDSELQAVNERLQGIEQRYNKVIRHYEHEAAVQDEKSREFEQLAIKVKELSATLRHSPLPGSSRDDTYYSEEV